MNFKYLLLILTFVSFSSFAHVKIATLDQYYVMEQSVQGKRMAKQLNEERNRVAIELQKRERDIKEAHENYRKHRDSVSENHYRQKLKSYQLFKQDAEKRLKSYEKDNLSRLDANLSAIVLKMFNQGNYDLLLTKSNFSITTKKLDITMKVLQEYNRQHP